jgi:hypothetical protein
MKNVSATDVNKIQFEEKKIFITHCFKREKRKKQKTKNPPKKPTYIESEKTRILIYVYGSSNV